MHVEEHEMKKGYDKKLLKRLLTYAMPYRGLIFLSLILLLVVVSIELIRPILIGRAVDDMISNYDKTYSMVSEEVKGATLINGQYYIVDEKNQYKTNEKATIVYDESYDTGYFLISDITREQQKILENEYTIHYEDEQYYVTLDDENIEIIPLTNEDIKGLRDNDIRELINITIIFIVILIVGLLITYFQTILLHFTGQKIIYNIRNEIFTHIQSLSVQFFNKNPVGKLVTRVTNDTETLNEMYTNVIVNSVKNTLVLIGLSTMMLILDWQLTLIIFFVLPLIIIATMLFRFFSRKVYRTIRTKVAAINTFLSEHISGMKIVQIFSQEERKMEEFNNANTDLKNANMKQLIIFSIYRPSMYFIYVVGLGIVLGFGGKEVLAGEMSVGTLIIFIQYIANFFHPIQELAEQFNILQSAMASAEKIFSLLDEQPEITDVANATRPSLKGEIEFRNVWFAYIDEDWVLKDVSFKVKPGETFAFVGATGAGKTSILNLISRYYDIQKGEILLDGINIRDIKIEHLRSYIGQMMQDVFLFTGDIKSNIRLRNDDISMNEIKKASTYVNADKFISKLPKKYDEKVYERGATFSAGQRQLLSFARTLAFAPAILILDEATSNIDTETELLIQDALYKLMEGRTTLVVAHRLSTIQHADKIIVLHKGRVKEVGNHQELLANKGIYYNLYQLQYQEID